VLVQVGFRQKSSCFGKKYVPQSQHCVPINRG
jgi:hypothetical protein